MSSMRQVSGPSLASSPLLPQYDEDKTALLGILTSDDEAYTPSLGNLPGALKQRRLFSRLPTPRHAAPLVCAIALLGTLAYFATSVGEFFAAQRDGLPHGRALARAFHHEPKWPLLEDGVAVLEAAEGQHTVTAIVLHGLGDVGDGKPFTWNMPSRFPVAPTSDYLNVTVRNGEGTHGWFDIASFEDIYENEDVVGYIHSQQQVNRLIEEERERLIAAGKEPRIVLMGFSQGASPFRPFDSFGSIIDELFDNSGGAMALLSTLTSPHANRIEAAVVLATYLPLIDDMEDLFSPHARDTPLLWLHGRADPHLSYANAELGISRLLFSPISMTDITFHGYEDLAHTYNDEELREVEGWFAAKVPQHQRLTAQDEADRGERPQRVARQGRKACLVNVYGSDRLQIQNVRPGAVSTL
ncbi:hypothetical protein Rhopal_003604-T1 [Rhodotorula paludigena]|uniref:Acyl-protein thioesterase 1 n=1 Tax=Rhodotorula paludigena TaxID=86838 RepID=A0AAV5GNK4_9BASI|nr:hypothetical protein Rhopal_003604-T1 [Rhodotorula paludigena]